METGSQLKLSHMSGNKPQERDWERPVDEPGLLVAGELHQPDAQLRDGRGGRRVSNEKRSMLFPPEAQPFLGAAAAAEAAGAGRVTSR